MSLTNWTDGSNSTEGLADICAAFQLDISCLVDGELDDAAAGRAMFHLESCDGCRRFFEDTRRQVRLHRDVQDPERLMAHLTTLTGGNLLARVEEVDLVHRLSSIFYQLGKAYALAGMDPEHHHRQFVFEDAVPVAETKVRGRGFVDGVLLGGKDDDRVDWRNARHMLNGRLERIADPLEKGRRLLREAIAVDPSHEEARLHLANIWSYENKPLKAAAAYKAVFDSAVQLENRAHAAVQLGRLHKAEGDLRKALIYWRWVTLSGLAEYDERFWFVRFNVALAYALEGAVERSLAAFRTLIDRHPDRIPTIAEALYTGDELRAAVESQHGFAEAMMRRLPELFDASGADTDA